MVYDPISLLDQITRAYAALDYIPEVVLEALYRPRDEDIGLYLASNQARQIEVYLNDSLVTRAEVGSHFALAINSNGAGQA